jgi:hypothetical protein
MILNFFTLHQNDFPGAHRPLSTALCPAALSPPPSALSSPPFAL